VKTRKPNPKRRKNKDKSIETLVGQGKKTQKRNEKKT